MGATRSTAFTTEQLELAAIAKAMGHPARIAILQALSERNACVCGEIVDVVGLAQSTVSQHLKELKSAGFIKGTVEGQKTCYCIDAERFNELQSKLSEILKNVASCC